MGRSMFVIEEKGIIYDGSTGSHQERISFFTTLCKLDSGTILCGFQNGPIKHSVSSTIKICRSTDGGSTWLPTGKSFRTMIDGVPGSLSTAEMVEVFPGRVLLFATWFDRSEPERPLFDPVTEGILKSRQLVCVSVDEGLTWGDWQEITTGDLRGCSFTGPIIKWKDGVIAVPFESYKEYDDPGEKKHGAWLLVSSDGGYNFSRPLLVAQHPGHEIYYWDQRLCRGMGDGDFFAFFWTHHLGKKCDLPVHFLKGRFFSSRLICEPIRITSIPGQISAPLLLPDGNLIVFVVNRENPGSLTLWHSCDGGMSWPSENNLVVHSHDERAVLSQGLKNIDFKQYWEDMGKWSFGHPVICQLSDEKILLAWYAGAPDCMSIHWARISLKGKA